MQLCDICSSPTSFVEGTRYRRREFQRLVAGGFKPDEMTLARMAALMQISADVALTRWKTILVPQSTTDWLLCPACASRAGTPAKTTEFQLSPKAIRILFLSALILCAGGGLIFFSRWYEGKDRWVSSGLQGKTIKSVTFAKEEYYGGIVKEYYYALTDLDSDSKTHGSSGLYRLEKQQWKMIQPVSDTTRLFVVEGFFFYRSSRNKDGDAVIEWSHDNKTWENRYTAADSEITALSVDGDDLHAAVFRIRPKQQREIIRSLDRGRNWETIYKEEITGRKDFIPESFPVRGFYFYGGVGICAWSSSSVFCTGDFGKSWKQLRIPPSAVIHQVAFFWDSFSKDHFAGGFGEIFVATSQGILNWKNLHASPLPVNLKGEVTALCILRGKNLIYAGLPDRKGTVLVSGNSGKTWKKVGTLGCPVSWLGTAGHQFFAGGRYLEDQKTSGGIYIPAKSIH